MEAGVAPIAHASTGQGTVRSALQQISHPELALYLFISSILVVLPIQMRVSVLLSIQLGRRRSSSQLCEPASTVENTRTHLGPHTSYRHLHWRRQMGIL